MPILSMHCFLKINTNKHYFMKKKGKEESSWRTKESWAKDQKSFARAVGWTGTARNNAAGGTTARHLIVEASKKLSDAVQGNNLQGAKVAQAMLSAGNEKVNVTAKQLGLAEIKHMRKIKLKTGKTRADSQRQEEDCYPSHYVRVC